MKTMTQKGFTIIEILIVIVTVVILASLAIPAYQATIEKSRKAEAVRVLSAIRAAQLRYYTLSGAYTTTMARLDFNPSSAGGGQGSHFTYCMTSADNQSFVASALRNTQNSQGLEGTQQALIQINQSGAVSETQGPGRFRIGQGGSMTIITLVPAELPSGNGVCAEEPAPPGRIFATS